jgi:hypothetical protein
MWKRGGYERGAYWAQNSDGLMRFPVEISADEAQYQANRRQAQKSRDVFIREQNKKVG